MLQTEEQLIKYYKEYSCVSFNPTNITSFAWERQVNFREKSLEYQLPSTFIDTYKQQPNLYFLCWITTSTNHSLLVKRVNDQYWGKVILNHLPANIIITDQRIFLFGKSQIIIIPLGIEETINIFPLQSGKIIDLKICYTNRGESGVSMVYFNKKKGYFKKEYSKSISISCWQKIKPYLNFSLEQFSQYRFFSIILPNLIGIAFVDEQQFMVYDLNRMKPASFQLFSLKSLNKGNNIKIRGELAEPSLGFQDSLRLFISNDCTIEVFKLEIVRLQVQIDDKEFDPQQITIDRLVDGNIIDWQKSKFEHEYFIPFPARINDFIINGREVVIYSQDKDIQSIPTFFKVQLSQKQTLHKIISQESIIWQDYFRKKLYNQTEEGDLFYGADNLCLEIEKDKYQNISNKKSVSDEGNLHYKWLNQHHFKELIVINNRIYITRINSITTFEQISKNQYLINHFSDEQKKQAEIQLQTMSNNQNTKMKWTVIAPKLQSESLSQQQTQFKNILNQIKKFIEIPIILDQRQLQAHFTTVLLQFNYQYSANLAKDKIIYFASFLNYFVNSQRIIDLSIKNKLIINYLQYFSSSFINNKDHYRIFDKSFIDQLIDKSHQQFTLYHQINIIIIFKKILQNLLPGFHERISDFKENKYLEMLISELINSNVQDKSWIIQRELKKFVSVTLNIDGFAKEAFSSSSLLFQAYLLTHPAQQQLQNLFLQILKINNSKIFLNQLAKISHLIPNQLQILLPLQRNSQIKIKIAKNLFIDQTIMKNGSEEMGISPEIVNNLLYKNTLLRDRNYLYGNEKQSLNILLSQFVKAQLSTCLLVHKNILEKYNKLKGKELQNQHYQHLLQIEQSMLINYTSLFNRVFQEAANCSTDTIEGYRFNLVQFLAQIYKSFINYKKYYNKLYQSNDMQLNNELKEIEVSINEEEEFMTGGFTQQPIILLDSICCRIWIQIIYQTLDNQSLFYRFVEQMNKFNGESMLMFAIKSRLSNPVYVYEDIDKLFYYLIKKGEKSTVQLMRTPDFNADRLYSCFTDRNNANYLLSLVRQEIKMNHLNQSFVNPMKY